MAAQSLFFGPLLYFRTIPALDRLSSALLGAIAQHAEEEFFPAGSSLLRQDHPREAFFVIVEGRVAVREPDGREELLGPGQAVGFLHLLARSEEGLEAQAVWDTVALRVDWDAHLDACERHFPILEVHMGFLAHQCLEERKRARKDAPLQPPEVMEAPDGWAPPGANEPGTLPPAPLNLVQRIQVLHRSRAFPSAGMDALAELARHLEEVRHPAGEEHWAHGDPSGSFLLVASGSLVLEGPNGGWREVLGPGEVAGRFEALAGLPREGSLRAEGPSVSLRLGLEALMDILEDHSTMAVEVTAGLARDLIRLQDAGPPPTPAPEIL
jgi:CRP-like cAMP-binding protein